MCRLKILLAVVAAMVLMIAAAAPAMADIRSGNDWNDNDGIYIVGDVEDLYDNGYWYGPHYNDYYGGEEVLYLTPWGGYVLEWDDGGYEVDEFYPYTYYPSGWWW